MWGARPNDDAQTYQITQLNELATDLFRSDPVFVCPIRFGLNNEKDEYASQLVLIGYSDYCIIMQILQEENIVAFSRAFAPVDDNFSRTYITPVAMGVGIEGSYILASMTTAGEIGDMHWVEPSWQTTNG